MRILSDFAEIRRTQTRNWALLTIFATSVVPVCAAQRSTVQQLQQFLVQQQAAHRSDGEIARELGSVHLTERLAQPDLDRIREEIKPGAQTAAALDLLADLSAFLASPASELPHKDPPESAEQREILKAADQFVNSTLQRLPDFLATRTTRSFEDIPVLMRRHTFQSGLHAADTHTSGVAYRAGHEIANSATADAGANASEGQFSLGLTSTGEFGPVLATIMKDSANGTITWSHWEQTSEGLAAVFRYSVPKQASHYEVDLCCVWMTAANSVVSYRGKPAYHGFLWINPSTGAIVRVTLEAQFKDFDIPPRYGLMVKYGKVDIGGSSFICPVRSVVITQIDTPANGHTWMNFYLNEVKFTGYHKFGSTVRILPTAPAKQ